MAAVRTEAAIFAFLNPPNAASYSQKQVESALVDRVIGERLVTADAARHHAKLSGSPYLTQAVSEFSNVVQKAYATSSDWQKALATRHLTRAQVEHWLADQQALDAYLQHVVKAPAVSAAAIASYYHKNLSQFQATAAYHIRDIVVATQTQADTVLAKLHRGANFATLAQTESLDVAHAAQGGDMGFVTLSQLQPAVAAAVRVAPAGKFRTVHTRNGVAVFEVLAVRPAGQQSLAAATPSIRQYLQAQAFQTAAATYVDKLAKATHIRILWPTPVPATGG